MDAHPIALRVAARAVSLACWENSTDIQDWMQAHNITTELELLQYFELDLVSTVIDALGKRPVVWQDLFDSGVELPPTVILDVWKDWTASGTMFNATAASYDVVFSACWYLDHLNEDWWSFYECNPRGYNLSAVQQARVLGGHASMWGERVDETDFFERVWPRTSATAEILWSGSPQNMTDISYSLVRGRLERFRCSMIDQFSIPASPIAPGYCGKPPVAADIGAHLPLPPLMDA